MASDPSPYDHVRSDGGPVRPGTYRVVGVVEGVTLLRVADERGKRVHEGEVVSVSLAEYRRLDAAANPDEPSLLGSLALTLFGGALLVGEVGSDLLGAVAGAVGIGLLEAVLVFAAALTVVVGVKRLVRLRRLRG